MTEAREDLDRHLPGIAAGDLDAFTAWMKRAEGPLRRALGSFRTQVDVEAVLQEALLRVWQVAPGVEADGRPNGLLRMAHRIAKNLAIDEARRARLDFVDEPADLERLLAAEPPSPPDPHLRRAIEACREELPEKPRQALGARLDGAGTRPDAELAAELRMTTNTFLQNFTRARKLLAACLEGRGVDWQEELG